MHSLCPLATNKTCHRTNFLETVFKEGQNDFLNLRMSLVFLFPYFFFYLSLCLPLRETVRPESSPGSCLHSDFSFAVFIHSPDRGLDLAVKQAYFMTTHGNYCEAVRYQANI